MTHSLVARPLVAANTNSAVEESSDPRFRKILDIEFLVPDSYCPVLAVQSFINTQIALSRPGAFHHPHDFSDHACARVSRALKPGEELHLQVFQDAGALAISYEDRMVFLRRHKALLVGAQGLCLTYPTIMRTFKGRHEGVAFPNISCIVTLDERERLPVLGDGRPQVPALWSNHSVTHLNLFEPDLIPLDVFMLCVQRANTC